jgi:hypothetical protein
MKMTNLALVASVFALAAAARGESYTFTPGTEIPLGSDYVATSDCSIQNDGYTVGSTHNGSSVALSLRNAASGDYVLSMKGGAKNLSAAYSLTVTDGVDFVWRTDGAQADTGDWTAYDEVSFVVKSLPVGEFTLTLAITDTTGSYAGNYGYFKFSAIESCALVIPSAADYRSTAYASCTGCSVDQVNGTVNSVKNGHTFSVVFYCAEKGWYNYSFKSGAKSEWGTSSIEWTLRNASKSSDSSENVSTTAIGGVGYSFHGGAALQNSHQVDLGILDAGLYVLTATAVKSDSNYVANFGEFAFASRAFDTVVSGEEIVLGVSKKGEAKEYVSLSNCSIDDPVQVIGSTHNASRMTVALYNETPGEWTLSWLGGAQSLTATYTVSVIGKSYSRNGNFSQSDTSSWTPSQAESLLLEDLPAGAFELVLEITSTTGSYAGNYGHFKFVRKMPDVVVTTVTAWDDEWNSADSVTFSGDGALVVDASDYARWDSATKSFTLGNSTVNGLTPANILVALGTAAATATAAYSEGSVTVTVAASSPAAETTWCGMGSNAAWSTAANWTHGVPSETLPANFVASAEVDLSADAVVKTLSLNGKTVTLNGSGKHIQIDYFAPDESGTIALRNAYLWSNGVRESRKDLVIPSGVSIRVLAGGRSEIQDNWGDVTVNGPIVMEDGSQLRTLYAVALLGGLSGSGTIDESGSGRRTFSGDWSGFTGSYSGGSDNVVFIGDVDASVSAWTLPVGISVGTSAGNAGTVKFGSLTMQPAEAKTITLFKDTVIQVGAGCINANVSVSGGSLALEKVGTGTLTLDGCTLAALTVSEGAIAAGANAPTVGTLAMAAGSYVVANTTATINATTAAIDGVKVLVADATALAAGTTYSLVSATALSGMPEVYAVDSEGNHVPAANGKPKNVWIAKARANALRLSEGNPNAGMTVVIR